MKMIKLTEKHYILVDDNFDPIGSDGKYVHKSGRIWQWDSGMAYVSNNPPQPITHSTQPLELDTKNGEYWYWKNIKQLSLSEVEELLGVVDVEKKAKNHLDEQYNNEDIAHPELYDAYHSFLKGYNQAIEDNKEKKYTEEDMRKAYYQGHKSGLGSENGLTFEHTIQSLQHKTEWEVEFVDGKLKLKS